MSPDDPRHGTNAGYIAGCRGDCCRPAHADYRRGMRAARYLKRTDRLIVAGLGTQRRLRALLALGWRWEDIEAAAEPGPRGRRNLSKVAEQDMVHVDTARRVAAVYEALCMTPGPSERTRNRARRLGYVPPLAWDDIDDPTEHPKLGHNTARKSYIDHAAVERRLAGDRSVRLHPGEAAEVVRRALRAGRSTTWIETQLGLKPERYTRADAVGGDLHAVEWREAS